jgi:hypothetical protein
MMNMKVQPQQDPIAMPVPSGPTSPYITHAFTGTAMGYPMGFPTLPSH